VQNVDVIIDSGKYAGKQALIQKKGMRTAMGSAQWLSLRNYPSTLEAVKDIKENQGYKIFASDLNPSSKDVRDLEWDVGPVCIVMGNEELGISDEMRELADETFTLPMVGFAESFNLSVATSITLAHMSAKSKNGKGPLKPGDLDEHEFNCLYLKGLLNSLPQKKLGPAILRQNGIHLPHEFNLL
jgi:tRNA G18 (ribose-2'-O)-methylase SpoU